jgi:hypothetical protein
LTPESDSVLKVRAKESFGVNIETTLYQVSKNKEVARSLQLGTTEVLASSELKAGV